MMMCLFWTKGKYTLASCFLDDLEPCKVESFQIWPKSVAHFWLWTNKMQLFPFSFLEVFEWVQRSNCQKEAARSSYFYGFNPALTTNYNDCSNCWCVNSKYVWVCCIFIKCNVAQLDHLHAEISFVLHSSSLWYTLLSVMKLVQQKNMK